MNREDSPENRGRGPPTPESPPSEEIPKNPNGYVSTLHQCQTTEASKLCIYDIHQKLKESNDYYIGGTYSDTDPELWFYYTTSLCHGNNHLLNLFVYNRKPGNYAIHLSNSNQLTQKTVLDDDVSHLVLPNTLKSYQFKFTKPNQSHYLKTYNFATDFSLFNLLSLLIIPIKIEMNPTFVLDENILKTIKLKHDMRGLLTKQEKTDFVLVSASKKQFPTHKILLAAHSPVLRSMVKNGKPTSLFIDISDNDMELLLEFIYTGTIKNVMDHGCLKLLEIADKFQLKPLFMLTQYTIGNHINIGNAVDIAIIAKKYNLKELEIKVFDYIIKNPDVMNTPAWMNLNDVELTKYLFQYMHTMKD